MIAVHQRYEAAAISIRKGLFKCTLECFSLQSIALNRTFLAVSNFYANFVASAIFGDATVSYFIFLIKFLVHIMHCGAEWPYLKKPMVQSNATKLKNKSFLEAPDNVITSLIGIIHKPCGQFFGHFDPLPSLRTILLNKK